MFKTKLSGFLAYSTISLFGLVFLSFAWAFKVESETEAVILSLRISQRVSKASLVSCLTDTAGSWTTRAPMPTGRIGAAVVAGLDGKIYVIGGDGDTAYFLTTVEAYDPLTNTWSTKASMRKGRNSLIAVAGLDGKIYAIGGYGSNGFTADASGFTVVEAYDPVRNTWATKAPMPTGRTALAGAAGLDGKIYVMGGYDPYKYDDYSTGFVVEAYDPVNNTWARKASMPTGRTSLAAVAGADGKIYAIGGYDIRDSGPSEYYSKTVESYDPLSDIWTTNASMPTGRNTFAAAAGPDGKIYAIGGMDSSHPGGFGGSNNIEAFDLTTNTWDLGVKAAMPTGRYYLGAAAGLDGKIYAIGGTVNNVNAFDIVEAYTPSTDKVGCVN